MKKVYLASPFFNEKEVKDMEEVKNILRAKGLKVFAPFENQNKHLTFGSPEWRVATWNGDVAAIKDCEAVVAVMNHGNYEDAGTAWEVGYAFAIGKPVIVVSTSNKTINLMISDSLHAYIESIENLVGYDFVAMPKINYTKEVW